MEQIFSDFYVERDEYLGKELQKIMDYYRESYPKKDLFVQQVVKVDDTLFTAIINVM
ncbi:hypothetical protein [Brevibacillus migulae]|uniref:hypothetical protein n=1 Tax=Brevibacillus migulae TaxID=1644114 RepID=UPI0014313129|nr:hypothetical protein [Brevibacillus migulae]